MRADLLESAQRTFDGTFRTLLIPDIISQWATSWRTGRPTRQQSQQSFQRVRRASALCGCRTASAAPTGWRSEEAASPLRDQNSKAFQPFQLTFLPRG